jgi:hypothetical protein
VSFCNIILLYAPYKGSEFLEIRLIVKIAHVIFIRIEIRHFAVKANTYLRRGA